MESTKAQKITVEAIVKAPVEKVWKYWSDPGHVTKWNQASDDWHSPSGQNDLRKGGKFSFRMEAKDGSMGFDFGGVYDEVIPNEHIAYTMSDDRSVSVDFKSNGDETKITETFDAEETHSIEMQREGWQAILNNFKKYVEAN
jgi:uncharacterized protein YndB with AHSA1/START domain